MAVIKVALPATLLPKRTKNQPVLCSLTHLEITENTLLADEMRAYQEKRKKKLAQLPDSTSGGFIIKRKQ